MKKLLSAGIILALMTSLLALSSSTAPDLEGEVLPVLGILGVMNGDERGELNLTAPVTRAQFVKMAVACSALKTTGQAGAYISPYPDVRAGTWYAGYVTAARDAGWVTGYLDGTFRPDNQVTLEEALNIALKAMGYGAADFAYGFPASQLALYRSLELDDGMTAVQGQPLTRRDCAILLYNCLGAKAKSGMVYAQQLGYAVDAQGKINYGSLILTQAQGPVMLATTVEDAVGFTPRLVYRDRRASDVGSLRQADVLYYIKDVATVWAYSDKVSGVVQAISPSTVAPSAVTVSGVTVPLGSSGAIFAFSDPGTVKVGDKVTVLLGAGGQGVFVLTGGTLEESVTGVVLSVATGAQADARGNLIQSRQLTLFGADGRTHVYPYSGSLKAGDIAAAAVSGDELTVKKVKGSVTPSGTVENGLLDGYTLDEDSRIVDFLSARAVRLTARRLEKVDIASSDVAYCSVTGSHIDTLILKNVTGDMNDFGVVTSVSRSENLLAAPSTYVYMIGGVPGVLSAQSGFSAKVGPAVFEYKDGAVKTIKALDGKRVQLLGQLTVTLSDGTVMDLGGSVQFYRRSGDDWYLSSRAELAGLTLTAYYDDTAANGGAIRVIVGE